MAMLMARMGRKGALNVSTIACFVAAGAGAVVCKHGNRAATSTSGAFDLLEALGLPMDLEPADVERCVREAGIGFAFARTFHPAMRHAAPVRSELGVPMPIASATRQIVAQEVGAGNVDLDFATLLRTVARGAGLELVSENADVSDGLGSAA